MNEVRERAPWGVWLTRHIPPQQFGRYLLVGVSNSVFGYTTFAVFTALLTSLPYGYVVASFVSSLLNITVSYLAYKWFVFKTQGNYVKEWLRCVAVYSTGIVFSATALPVLVTALRRWAGLAGSAPYIAGAIIITGVTIYNFLAHKKFSFRSSF